jgi:hypothetical protein
VQAGAQDQQARPAEELQVAVVRNLRNGCYRLGMALGDARLRRVPQTMRAWDEITSVLQAA